MGLYVETATNFGKAQEMIDGWEAEAIPQPTEFAPPGSKALVCVVTNPTFEAAGVCFDEREFDAFSWAQDARPKQWLLVDRELLVGHLRSQGYDDIKLAYYGLA